jgi:hypothetical protein
MSIEVIGANGVHQMLQDYMEPKLPKRIQSATKAGATVFKAPVKAEASLVSKRLARSVSVRKARKDTPATILTFRPSVAWFRHFIIDGTQDHGPKKAALLAFIPNWNPYFTGGPPSGASQVRAHKVRGMKANPIIARVADAYENEAYQAIDADLTKTESK